MVGSRTKHSWQPKLVTLLGRVVTHGFLLLFSAIAIIPFVWLFFGTFKPYRELVSSSALLPVDWTLENYREIFTRLYFGRAFANSLILATASTLTTLLTSAATGFLFGRYQFWARDTLFSLILATMMIPGTLTMVPLYIFISNLGLVNSLYAIFVPGLWSTFGCFLMRQFIADLPVDMFDAARIDGAAEWMVFVRIVIPMAKSPLAALAVLTFLGSWDGFMWPLIVINDAKKYTLPLLLNSLRSLYWSRYELWAAGAMLTIAPVMLLYIFSSRFFIRGLAVTGK